MTVAPLKIAKDIAMPNDVLPLDAAEDPVASRRLTIPKLISVAAVVGIVYLAKDVLLPLSIAMLITFALSPLATRLRKLGLPNLASVLVVVAGAFAAIGLFVLIVSSQLGSLAQNLPSFQANILAKVETLKSAGSDNGLISRVVKMMTVINEEIGEAVPTQPVAGQTAGPANTNVPAAGGATVTEPLPVEVIESQSPLAMLQDLVLPLVSPIAMVGLVIVVVIFMLLEREDLRDRFIKLVGSSDLHRTTQVLQEAGRRVGQYLLVQLLVNVIYAIPIGLGLWLIGVPNAVLWGLLTLVLRFVPYIGSVLAAAFPLFLAFAVSPGWSAVLWTVALFGIIELITSNIIEPYLYGSRTGVSPLAVIVSAIFWTWIWGPLGLVLSTPLTVCLVVLGRHIPQFEVFDIMFGDDPVLPPHARLYQRMLVGDTIEATFLAQETLETSYLSDYYRDVGLPALLIAQNDHARGVLTTDQRRRLAVVAQAMVADLAPVIAEELEEMTAAQAETPPDPGADPAKPAPVNDLPGKGYRVLCVGGRTDLDDAAAAMLSQTLAAEGAEAELRLHTDLSPSRFAALQTDDRDCLVLTFLDANPSRASLLHIRRIKLAAPNLRVGVFICELPKGETSPADHAGALQRVDGAVLLSAGEIGADFAVSSLEDVAREAFQKTAPLALPKTRRSARTRSVPLAPRAAVA